MYCHNAVWEASAERALRHYRDAGFPTATCVGHLAAALYYGPTPAADGIARCLDLLDVEVEDRSGEANVLAHLAALAAMVGRFDDARDQLARARQIYTDLDQPTAIARTCAPLDASVAQLAGDSERAAYVLTESCEALRTMRNWVHLGTQGALLADALYALGRIDDAQAWNDVARTHALPDDASAQFSWRAAGARLAARSGDMERAERLAQEAVTIVDGTDALNQRADVRLVVAEVHAAAAKPTEATAATADALRLFEEKGNATAAARIRDERRAAAIS